MAGVLLAAGCAGSPSETGLSDRPESAAAAASPSAALPPPASSPAPEAAQRPSPPESLHIPATGTQSRLLHLGLRDDGSLDVPPEPPGSPAGWYTGSPAPGQQGPAVLLGHVNATGGGPGVFADLKSLKAGDVIEVGREDGTTAVFTVDRGEQYGKEGFPTLEVYGNTEGAELRLITCDGFDPATGEFEDNYVVYAVLDPGAGGAGE
ncbi:MULTISPECIES: class F sortase [Arthrobacter]|uniref:class F sortase n=1 Tax=Arthrobacter TaxID=1663 RepID=UPI001F1C2A1F|nr:MULTISPECIES: class F sortase [unclassified Arthrobacter]